MSESFSGANMTSKPIGPFTRIAPLRACLALASLAGVKVLHVLVVNTATGDKLEASASEIAGEFGELGLNERATIYLDVGEARRMRDAYNASMAEVIREG